MKLGAIGVKNEPCDAQNQCKYGSSKEITIEQIGKAPKNIGRTKGVDPNDIPIEV